VSRDSLTGDGASVDRYAESASSLRGLPGDLILATLYALVVGTAIAVVGLPELPRFVLGAPLVLFLPGYAVLSALFPGRPSRNAGRVSSLSGMARRFTSMRSIQRRGMRWGERAALSFGLSLFLIPMLALVLGFVTLLLGTSSLFRTGPVVGILVAVVLAGALVGTVRRLRLARAERFAVPVGYWLRDFADGLTDSPVDALLNVVLVLAILVGTASLGYALAVPQEAGGSANIHIGTTDDSGNFQFERPANLTVNQPQQYTLGVTNNGQQAENYTVVVQLQRRSGGEVLSREELKRFSSPTIPPNRTWRNQHTITPNISENNIRLVYLLYEGDPPANPTRNNAYRATWFSIDVSSGGSGGGGGG